MSSYFAGTKFGYLNQENKMTGLLIDENGMIRDKCPHFSFLEDNSSFRSQIFPGTLKSGKNKLYNFVHEKKTGKI
jgi:hypothetical protein